MNGILILMLTGLASWLLLALFRRFVPARVKIRKENAQSRFRQ